MVHTDSKKITAGLGLLLYLFLALITSRDLVLCVGANGHIALENNISATSFLEFGTGASSYTGAEAEYGAADKCVNCADVPFSIRSPHVSSGLSKAEIKQMTLQKAISFHPFFMSSPGSAPGNRFSSADPSINQNLVCLRSVTLLI